MKWLVLTLLSLYQRTRILRAPACRFYPSCSTYMAQAIEGHGLLKGLFIGGMRLVRCHPFHPGGVDEVSMPQTKYSGVEDSEEESATERLHKIMEESEELSATEHVNARLGADKLEIQTSPVPAALN